MHDVAEDSILRRTIRSGHPRTYGLLAMPDSSAFERLRPLAANLFVLFAFGGIPGASLRPVAWIPAPAIRRADENRGAVDVTVRAASTSATIPLTVVRAFVRVQDKAYLADTRFTDGQGVAHLRGLPDGAAWIVADARGFARRSSPLTIAGEPAKLTLELNPEHTLAVTVTDDRSAPLVSAEVEVAGAVDPMPVGARTQADGTVRIGGLDEGPWSVAARAAGYEEKIARATRDGEGVVIALRRLAELRVRTVDGLDRPVAGAHVSVAGAALWPARSADTDEAGQVTITGLPTGTVELRATLHDLVSTTEIGVEVAAERHADVVLRLAPGRWATVRVTAGDDVDAVAVPGARVTLAERGLTPFPLEAVTDKRGLARLGPFASGSATVSAQADGFMSRGGIPLAEVVATETRIALDRAGALTGRVTDVRGFPIEGATIEVTGTDVRGDPILVDPRRASVQATHFQAMLSGPSPLLPAGELGILPGPVPSIPGAARVDVAARMDARPRWVAPSVEPWTTRADGTFSAKPAPPGQLRIVVHHPQYAEADSAVVGLLPGGEAHIDVVMHEGGALEGRVLDARDRPVDGARIYVTATRGPLERTTHTAGDGTFAVLGLPESIDLVAGTDDDPDEIKMSLSIPEGGRRELVVRLPPPRESMDVSVVDERHSPIGGAQVSVSSLSADTPLRATEFTDDRGHAVVKHVRGLPLRIETSAARYARRGVTVDSAPSDVAVEMVPAVRATGSVVTARTGDPVAQADVMLVSSLGVRRARTSANGTYDLDGLAPGVVQLRVRAKGFAEGTEQATVPAMDGSRDTELPPVELAAEGVVEGEVVDSRGDFVANARVAKDHAPTWIVVGTTPWGVVATDSRGRFSIGELPEGSVTLEAYAAGAGRGRAEGIAVKAGRTMVGVRIVLVGGSRDDANIEPTVGGSVAVTLGESADPVEVVITSVAEGSQAERSGLAVGDVISAVDGSPVRTMQEARDRMSGPLAEEVILHLQRGTRAVILSVAREPVRR
jgi:protocatechuate 3,4-dioxygenase beta subunit